MLKKFLIVIGGFVAVVLVLGAVKVAQIKQLSSMPHVQPATAVTTIMAKSVAWHPVLQAIGTLAPVQGVTVSADAEGTIIRIAADSGTTVKAGDLLFLSGLMAVEGGRLIDEARAPSATVCCFTLPSTWLSNCRIERVHVADCDGKQGENCGIHVRYADHAVSVARRVIYLVIGERSSI